MKKKLLLVLIPGVMATAAIPVIDVAAIAKLIDQLFTMKNQLETQIDTYKHHVWNAKHAFGKTRWRSVIAAWRYGVYSNTSGRTPPWVEAVTKGTDAAEAVISVSSRIPLLTATYTGDTRIRKTQQLAQIEIADGAAVKAIGTLGDLQSKQQGLNTAVTELERFVMDDRKDENTQAMLLNQIAGAEVIALRQKQQELSLMAAQAELAAAEAVRRRDGMAAAMRQEQAFLTGHGAINTRTFGSGTSRTITSFRGF